MVTITGTNDGPVQNRAGTSSIVDILTTTQQEAEHELLPELTSNQSNESQGSSRVIKIDDRIKKFKRFKSLTREVVFDISGSPKDVSDIATMNSLAAEILNIIKGTHDDNAWCGALLGYTNDNAESPRAPYYLTPRPVALITLEDVFGLLKRLSQSGTDIPENSKFFLNLYFTDNATGSGRNRITPKGIFRGVLTVTNNDNLCLPRSIVLAEAYSRKKENPREWDQIRRSNAMAQTIAACRLARNSGVKPTRNGCSIAEIQGYQRFLVSEAIAFILFHSN